MLDPNSPRNAARGALIAAVCVSLWACDDARRDDADEPSGDAETQEEERDGEAADERDAAETRELDAAASDGGAGNTRDASASDARSGQRDDRLQPFEVGRSWSYARTTFDGGADAACMGSLESAITRQVTRDAAVGYEYQPTCLGTTKVQMFFEGDDIWAWVGNALQPIHYAASPVQPGVSWDAGGTQYRWEAQETITVRAGTFDRCVRRTAVGGSGYIVLCRGVGLVFNESQSEDLRMELVNKNF